MQKRRGLVLVALVALAVGLATRPGKAGTPISVNAEQRRAYLAIVAEGALSPVPAQPVIARIRTGTTTALPTAVTVGADGSFHVELSTTKRLLPDVYTFELASGETVVASQTFRVGTPEEIQPSRELLQKWLTGSRRTLRELVAALERQARYHSAQVRKGGGPPLPRIVDVQRKAWKAAQKSFDELILNARMDDALFDREVLLPPFPDAGVALRKLFPAIEARRVELQQALETAAGGSAAYPQDPKAILDLARSSAVALELADDSASWLAGPLGEPEPIPTGERALSGTPGWTLTLPEAWKVEDLRTDESDDPTVRVKITGPEGLTARIRVFEFAEAQSWDELRGIAKVASWEEGGGHSYKIADKPIDLPEKRTFKIFATVFEGVLQRRVIVMLAPPDGRRLVGLTVQIPDSVWAEKEIAEVDSATASFQLK
jgi:hypothetical protein